MKRAVCLLFLLLSSCVDEPAFATGTGYHYTGNMLVALIFILLAAGFVVLSILYETWEAYQCRSMDIWQLWEKALWIRGSKPGKYYPANIYARVYQRRVIDSQQ